MIIGVREVILLIEDDKQYADLLVSHIKEKGFEVEHKQDLLDLNPIARISSYDLIILDYYLNYLSGGEIASFVNNISEEELPIVVISGDHGVEQKLPQGVRLFFHKSRPMRELAEFCAEEIKRINLVKYYKGSR